MNDSNDTRALVLVLTFGVLMLVAILAYRIKSESRRVDDLEHRVKMLELSKMK